jgi:hypothetical protein
LIFTRERFKGRPDEFFVKPAATADEPRAQAGDIDLRR